MSSVAHRPSPVRMDSSFTRHSNTAGAPLPSIPRRISHRSVNSVQAVFPSSVDALAATPSASEPSTEDVLPKARGESSSSSDSPLEFNAKRSRRAPQLRAPEASTPTPDVYRATLAASQDFVSAIPATTAPNDEIPRSLSELPPTLYRGRNPNLSINLDYAQAANDLASSGFVLAESRIRKKSGEPLKSSLKCKTPVPRNDLSVLIGGPFVASKSEPTTPTHMRSKSVQFAEQLERVKLFLAEQKPLAVSRDGSPTDDTSGTESDFPSFIYGVSDEEKKKKNLVMKVVNMPKKASLNVDVRLEDVSLNQDATIHGHLQVRNLAFQKWLAVRFTFDWWQTTSEVTAKYEKSVDELYDRFSFSIRIHDMLSKIEEKTMYMAIRYSVNGREIWDNNSGQNYEFKFSVTQPQPNPAPVDVGPLVGDLKTKLEQMVKGNTDPVGSFLNNRRRVVTHTGAPTPPLDAENFNFHSATPLSSRYDFSASLKNPWKREDYGRTHTRMNTYPSSPNTVPWPQQPKKPYTSQYTRGSPRIDDDYEDTNVAPIIHNQDVDVVDNEQISVISPTRRGGNRNHHRGYFDGASPLLSNARMTPPGSPIDVLASSSSIHRNFSIPSSPPKSSTHVFPSTSRESSSDSTPYMSDPRSPARSNTPSPQPRMVVDLVEQPGPEVKTGSDMAVFLNKFCFYTGPNASLGVSPDAIQRSHSTSSVEELLSSSSPRLSHLHGSFPSNRPQPLKSRSSSFDDVSSLSGGSTPTPTSTPMVRAF